MPKHDTTPLRVNGVIVVDAVQRELDEARRKHRSAYNRGYNLSERGFADRAQLLLDRINAELEAAEAAYAAARH